MRNCSSSDCGIFCLVEWILFVIFKPCIFSWFFISPCTKVYKGIQWTLYKLHTTPSCNNIRMVNNIRNHSMLMLLNITSQLINWIVLDSRYHIAPCRNVTHKEWRGCVLSSNKYTATIANCNIVTISNQKYFCILIWSHTDSSVSINAVGFISDNLVYNVQLSISQDFMEDYHTICHKFSHFWPHLWHKPLTGEALIW